jgi:hypothetical protein
MIYLCYIENDRICAVKLVKRGYENACIIGVLLPSTNYSVEEYLSYFSTVCSIYEQMSSDFDHSSTLRPTTILFDALHSKFLSKVIEIG